MPDDLRAELDAFSKRLNKPVSDLVRDAARQYVAVEQFRELRRRTLPYAQVQGILTDEDAIAASK